VTSDSIEQQLAELSQRLDALPEADEPPPTTLQVLGRSHQEKDWQRLLVHFLTPDDAHGLDHAVLEHLLEALADRDDLDYSYSRFDLDTVQVAQEVVTDQGRPDVIVWAEDWFICFELKIDSSEEQDQTERYVRVDSFDSIGLDKAEVAGHHYVYLAPKDAPCPDADEFVPVSWEWVASELQTFLAESYGEYPSRTTAQLNEFIDTIRSELTMTEYQENQQEKMELYVRHYDEIHEVQDAFDEGWSEFEQEWGTRLANAIDTGEVETVPTIPDEYVAFTFDREEDQPERWIFKQATSDWAWIFKDGWWKQADTRENIYGRDRPDVRIGFLHRLEKHRTNAVRDHELKFFFRLTPPSPDSFKDAFEQRFYDRETEIAGLTPKAGEITGNKTNMLEASYDIEVRNHDTFFDAYIAALREAVVGHAIENDALVSVIDNIYRTSLNEIEN
jgi:hypothetical protein